VKRENEGSAKKMRWKHNNSFFYIAKHTITSEKELCGKTIDGKRYLLKAN
jgi:hypothetical protein